MAEMPSGSKHPTEVQLVLATFYEDIATMLMNGAIRHLEKAKIRYELIKVPGALEIPQAIRLSSQFHDSLGYVALGCVIRGETSHYDIVATESARGLMQIGLDCIPVGNGILTVDSRDQATLRADPDRGNKGGHAAEACLSLLRLRQSLGDSQKAERKKHVAATPVAESFTAIRREQRTAARLAAVQALYQIETAGGNVEAVLEEYRTHHLRIDTDPDGVNNSATMVDADADLFTRLVTETIRHGSEVDTAIRARLTDDWPLERIDSVLRAVFRAAAGELLSDSEIPVKVVLSEYTGLVATFSDDERMIGFANGMLQGLARDLRPARRSSSTKDPGQ